MAIFFCWMCIHTPRISSELSNYVSSKILSISWLQAARIWALILPLSCCFVNFIISSTSGLFVISRKRLSYLCSIPSLIVHSKEKWNVHREINVTWSDFFLNSSKIWCLLKLWLRKKKLYLHVVVKVPPSTSLSIHQTLIWRNCLESPLAYSLQANSVLHFPANTRRKISFCLSIEMVAWDFGHFFTKCKVCATTITVTRDFGEQY